MSLFGDDDSTSPAAKPSSSLFDDDPKPALRSANSLFADDLGDESSPWAMPTPKKGGRASLVKTLLPASAVPDSYIDAYDALLEAGPRAENGLSVEAVERMMAESGVEEGVRSRVLEMVRTPGQDGVGREEFNVLVALVGLAQEGDEVTLDGVDERRKNLPVPRLSLPKSAKPEITDDRPATPPPSQPEPAPPAQTQAATQQTTPGRSRAPMRKQSFGDPEADPWGSPDMHRGHDHSNSYSAAPAHTNGLNAPAATRTTSGFTTSSATNSADPSGQRPSTLGTEGGWESYNSAATPSFSDATLGGDGFGAPSPGDGGRGSDPAGLGRSIGGGRIASTGVEETITVTAIAEKEGVFLFQHRNYEVASVRRNSKVVRRYSDFVWLLDCLHKRYPFRQLPLLPPKRVAINGNYIAADAGFVEKRRRGLKRFVNALVRHPVLREEQLVVMFLTVPTAQELSIWRKQANLSLQEEFTDKSLPRTSKTACQKDLPDLFDTVRSGVRQSAETYINLCNMLERLAKRNEGMAAETSRISASLTNLTTSSRETYAVDTNDIPLLNEGLGATAKHLEQSRGLLEDEARGWEEGVLEDAKRVRDGMVSMRDLFDRRDKYARDNIPALEKRIRGNEERLGSLKMRERDGGNVKVGEVERVEEAIFRDKASIVAQHARGVLIKECVRDEIVFFQSSIQLVGRLLQEWAQERVKYAELQAEGWRALSEEVEGMSVGV